MVRTRVLQTRQFNGVRIVLGDDPDDGKSYQVAIIKDFPSFYSAMDFLRNSEKRLKKGGDKLVSFAGD